MKRKMQAKILLQFCCIFLSTMKLLLTLQQETIDIEANFFYSYQSYYYFLFFFCWGLGGVGSGGEEGYKGMFLSNL